MKSAVLFIVLLFCGCQTNPPSIHPSEPSAHEDPLPIYRISDEETELVSRVLANPETIPTEVATRLTPKIFQVITEPQSLAAARLVGFRSSFASGCVVQHGNRYVMLSVSHIVVCDRPIMSIFTPLFGDYLPREEKKADPTLRVRIRDYRGNVFACAPMVIIPELDVGVYSINETNGILPETITPAIGKVEGGDQVYLCGAWGDTLRIQPATTVRFKLGVLTNSGVIINVMEVDRGIIPGFSGGPVFNSQWQLCGVNVSGDTKQWKHSHFAIWGSLNRALDGVNEKK